MCYRQLTSAAVRLLQRPRAAPAVCLSGGVALATIVHTSWEPVVSEGTLTGTVQVATSQGLIWKTFEAEVAMAGLRQTSTDIKSGESIPGLQLNLRHVSIDKRMKREDKDRLQARLERSLTTGRPVDIQYKCALICLPWNSGGRTLVQTVSEPK
jgi:hypothetical protein